jgi:glycosyltransferase involved in cell wall biosynthesis
MEETDNNILIVIPTRNRADLVPTAVRSVLDQAESNVRLVVSDNSTGQDEIERLSAYCKNFDGLVRYIRPPEPMAMPQHWEWAMEQALKDPTVTHVVFLSDRMLFKEGALRKLSRAVAAHPDRVISYNIDAIVDWDRPITIRQELWTGKILEIETAELGALSARSIFPHCLPRMVNSVAPRKVLEKFRARFGSVFASIAPDYCFAFRYLVLEKTLLLFDESLLVHYALDRSNGHSLARGVMNADYRDFVRNLGDNFRLPKMPLPDLLTGGNVMLNEYRFVKEETGSAKLPPIDEEAYLDYLLWETLQLKDPQARASSQQLLLELGAREPGQREIERLANRSIPRKVFDKIAWEIRLRSTQSSASQRHGTSKAEPPDLAPCFETTDEALDYVLRHPRMKSSTLAIHPFKSVPLTE